MKISSPSAVRYISDLPMKTERVWYARVSESGHANLDTAPQRPTPGYDRDPLCAGASARRPDLVLARWLHAGRRHMPGGHLGRGFTGSVPWSQARLGGPGAARRAKAGGTKWPVCRVW